MTILVIGTDSCLFSKAGSSKAARVSGGGKQNIRLMNKILKKGSKEKGGKGRSERERERVN